MVDGWHLTYTTWVRYSAASCIGKLLLTEDTINYKFLIFQHVYFHDILLVILRDFC
jgi:hypothetical protein